MFQSHQNLCLAVTLANGSTRVNHSDDSSAIFGTLRHVSIIYLRMCFTLRICISLQSLSASLDSNEALCNAVYIRCDQSRPVQVCLVQCSHCTTIAAMLGRAHNNVTIYIYMCTYIYVCIQHTYSHILMYNVQQHVYCIQIMI